MHSDLTLDAERVLHKKHLALLVDVLRQLLPLDIAI